MKDIDTRTVKRLDSLREKRRQRQITNGISREV